MTGLPSSSSSTTMKGLRWGAPARVFGGGARALGRHDWWRRQHCWVAATAAALAIALGVLVVSGRRRRGLPTWLLPSCLYHSFSCSFLLFSPSPLLPFF